jgi:hypothetical protein
VNDDGWASVSETVERLVWFGVWRRASYGATEKTWLAVWNSVWGEVDARVFTQVCDPVQLEKQEVSEDADP